MMEASKTKLGSSSGFTIVELLTVMGVIAILIGLLVPALALVRDKAKEIQQNSQFHSINVALELFKTDFGNYPESSENAEEVVPPGSLVPQDSANYGGANKLAEAVVGLDSLGFHPNSAFRSDNLNYYSDGPGSVQDYLVYHPDSDSAAGIDPLYYETAQENRDARKGPYMTLENANAYQMSDIYSIDVLGGYNTTLNAPDSFPSLVLCDVFTSKRETKKTGMPILYYRARTMFDQQDFADTDEIDDDIYYYPDNYYILELGMPENSAIVHVLADGGVGPNPGGTPDIGSTGDWEDFENMIINDQVTSVRRPYRADSFILISAGKDGNFGTADDQFNFTKDR